jgi:hypothetical protein
VFTIKRGTEFSLPKGMPWFSLIYNEENISDGTFCFVLEYQDSDGNLVGNDHKVSIHNSFVGQLLEANLNVE